MYKLIILGLTAAIAASPVTASLLDIGMKRLEQNGLTEGFSEGQLKSVRDRLENKLEQLNLKTNGILDEAMKNLEQKGLTKDLSENELATVKEKMRNKIEELNLIEAASDLDIFTDAWNWTKGAANTVYDTVIKPVGAWTEQAATDVWERTKKFVEDPKTAAEMTWNDIKYAGEKAGKVIMTSADYIATFGADIIKMLEAAAPATCPNG